MNEPTVHTITIDLCSLCINGAGGECHVPGCALWMNRAPDIAINDHPSFRVIDNLTAERDADDQASNDRLEEET